MYEYFWSHGMISDEIGHSIKEDCNFESYTFPYPHNESSSCNINMGAAYQVVSDYIDPYDVILDVCYPSIVEQELRLRKIVSFSPFIMLYFGHKSRNSCMIIKVLSVSFY